MSDDIINQAISESTPVEIPPPVELSQETETTPATEEIASTEPNVPEDIPFPKKAINALSRRDKQIGKLQAQLAAERAELAKYREQRVKTPELPSEESFDNYGEYLAAKHRAEFEQEQSQKTKQDEEKQAKAQKEQWYVEREGYAIEKAQQAIQNIPDYRQLLVENADIVQSFPEHVTDAFFEADEPALAFLALAKEGKLDSLLNMSPARVALEIGRAELRGEALSKVKPITKTPAPIEALKGTGSSTKSLETMNADELLKWLNKK